MSRLGDWLITSVTKRPHDFYVGAKSNEYLLRWYLIPRNRWFNIYLHKFQRSDDDRACHDHPWWNLTILLRGEYRELIETQWRWTTQKTWKHRRTGELVFRRAKTTHRIELFSSIPTRTGPATPQPCWTLFITGPKIRDWGFYCPKGFVPWQKFVNMENIGEVGPGCGE